jgi:hypothetical protein
MSSIWWIATPAKAAKPDKMTPDLIFQPDVETFGDLTQKHAWLATRVHEGGVLVAPQLVRQQIEHPVCQLRRRDQACRNGNFLAEILERKLAVVESRYSKSQLEYERCREFMAAEFGIEDAWGLVFLLKITWKRSQPPPKFLLRVKKQAAF